MRHSDVEHTSGRPDDPQAPMSLADVGELLRQRTVDPPLRPGLAAAIGDFDVLRVLGRGGMGVVLLARHRTTGELAALKVLRPELANDPHCVHRFLVEARHMHALSHPHILPVTHVGELKDRPYYVMPYMKRGTLADLIASSHAMKRQDVLRTAEQIGAAIAFAHARGILHRDLKPGNILLNEDGDAFVADFGLVRTLFNDSVIDAGAEAARPEGTAAYMSPAVARGEVEDTRCDIYSFGAVMYEMLTGRPPYEGRSARQVMDQVMSEPPTAILRRTPTAPAELAAIAEGAMARQLRDRYATMSDVVADLARVRQGRRPLGPRGTASAGKMSRRTFAGGVVVAAATIATSVWWQRRPDHSQPTQPPPQGGAKPPLLLPGPIGQFTGHTRLIRRLALSSDGKRLIAGDLDGAILIWNVDQPDQPRTIETKTSFFNAMCLLPDDGYLLTAHWDERLRIWNLESGELTHIQRISPGSPVRAAAVVPGGKSYIAASGSHVERRNVVSGAIEQQYQGMESTVLAVAVSPDGSLIAAVDDQTGQVWDLEGGATRYSFRSEDQDRESSGLLAFLPGGRRFLHAPANQPHVAVHDLSTQSAAIHFTWEPRTVMGQSTALTLTPGGDGYIVAAAGHPLLHVGLNPPKLLCSLVGHTGWVTDIAVAPRGDIAYSSSADGTVRVFRLVETAG